MITVKNLHKSFDGKTVLKDVSMSFREGQCNMLIGASGSGKTVLLNMLIGLTTPDSGEIWYDNDEFTQMSETEKKLLHQKIGVLFQGSALFDFRTVLGNVMFPMDFLTDWSEAEKKEKARYLLDKVNVKDSEDKYPDELSGGMQQRVGIAAAMLLIGIWNMTMRQKIREKTLQLAEPLGLSDSSPKDIPALFLAKTAYPL